MSNFSKRTTVYFEPVIHQALKIRAATANISLSEIVDDAVRALMNEDLDDIKSFSERANEPEMSYEELLIDLKK